MTTWFWSDPHIGHTNIIKHCNRPFKDAEEMNAALLRNYVNQVKPEDEVYILGDISFIGPKETNEFLDQLPGKKHLIPGNHDPSHIKNNKRFTNLGPLTEITLDGIHVVLCHYPLLSWNRGFHGAFMLHGHSHGMIPFDPLVRRLDVGVDDWGYAPVRWETVKTKLLEVPTFKEQRQLQEDKQKAAEAVQAAGRLISGG